MQAMVLNYLSQQLLDMRFLNNVYSDPGSHAIDGRCHKLFWNVIRAFDACSLSRNFRKTNGTPYSFSSGRHTVFVIVRVKNVDIIWYTHTLYRDEVQSTCFVKVSQGSRSHIWWKLASFVTNWWPLWWSGCHDFNCSCNKIKNDIS